MTEALCIYVPGKPVGWQRSGANGSQRYDPPMARAQKKNIAWRAKLAMQGREPLDGALRVEVIAWMLVPASWSQQKTALALGNQIQPTGKPDIDNVVKLALDALNKVAWKDDAAIVDLRASKRYGNPMQTVIIIERAGFRLKARAA